MLKLVFRRGYLFAEFKVNKYQPKDYETMCSLIKERYPIYNELIVTNKDVKLLDENNKLIGRYAASEARKKAMNMNKDIVLVNADSNPAICKVISFRQSILKKFYDEIVIKRNQQIISKAQSSKQLKISINLNQNQLQIKSKQIIQLAKKNLNVRIYAICKQPEVSQTLGKFDSLKSLLQNRCTIQKQIRVQSYEQKPDDEKKSKKGQDDVVVQKIISFVVKSKDNQFMNLLDQSKNKNPDQAIELFLKRFYKQEDVQMRDLQHKKDNMKNEVMGLLLVQQRVKQKKSQTKEVITEQRRKNETQIQKQMKQFRKQNSFIENEARARILNSRLKQILQIDS